MNYWILHKFPADLQRYAECEHCGFIYYNRCDNDLYSAGIFEGFECTALNIYPYCPMCGNKMNEEEYYYEKHDSGYIWDYERKEEDGYSTNV